MLLWSTKFVVIYRKHDRLIVNIFVYQSREEAEQAMKQLEGVTIKGKKIKLGWEKKSTTLLISGIPENSTIQQITKKFQKHGPLNPISPSDVRRDFVSGIWSLAMFTIFFWFHSVFCLIQISNTC